MKNTIASLKAQIATINRELELVKNTSGSVLCVVAIRNGMNTLRKLPCGGYDLRGLAWDSSTLRMQADDAAYAIAESHGLGCAVDLEIISVRDILVRSLAQITNILNAIQDSSFRAGETIAIAA